MSERREQRRVERCAGTGTVTRGNTPLGSVTYVMEIWQTFHIIKGFGPGPADEVAGMKEIHVSLVKHDLDAWKLTTDGGTLTMHFEDGRRLDGFLNGDEFVAGGQLTQA